MARFSFPEEVVRLEEEWGDELHSSGKYEAAISHFLGSFPKNYNEECCITEAGNSIKAADAAVKAKEWDRALQILNVISDQEAAAKFYGKIAEHFETTGDYEQAEKYYIDGGRAKDAVEMYNKAARWADAYKASYCRLKNRSVLKNAILQLAVEFLGADQTHEMYLKKAEELEQSGRLKEAEQLYLSFGEPARAIAMYKDANRTEEMMKLVEKYHGDRVEVYDFFFKKKCIFHFCRKRTNVWLRNLRKRETCRERKNNTSLLGIGSQQ